MSNKQNKQTYADKNIITLAEVTKTFAQRIMWFSVSYESELNQNNTYRQRRWRRGVTGLGINGLVRLTFTRVLPRQLE